MFFFPSHTHTSVHADTNTRGPSAYSPASTKSTEMAFSSLKQNPLVMCTFWQTKLRFSAKEIIREKDF